MIKYIYLTVICLILTAFNGVAESLTASGVVSKSAAILENAPAVIAPFTLISEGSENNGKLIMSKNKFCLTLPNMSSWYDGKTLWTYSRSAGEVNVSEPTLSEIAEINPLSYISAAKGKYNKRLLKTDSPRLVTVELTPGKGENSEFRKIVATFNASTYMPVKLLIYSAGSGVVTVNFKSVTVGKAQPASAFRFNEKNYPGIDIIDLR